MDQTLSIGIVLIYLKFCEIIDIREPEKQGITIREKKPAKNSCFS